MKKIKIKICGQRNLALINHAFQLGVDYQGLIFYSKSPRYVDDEILNNIHAKAVDYMHLENKLLDSLNQALFDSLQLLNYSL